MTNLWRCDYCGHQQDAEARKCADCGGPRGEKDFDPREWKSDNSNMHYSFVGHILDVNMSPSEFYQQYLSDERIKAQKALTDHLAEASATIGQAFIPVLKGML